MILWELATFARIRALSGTGFGFDGVFESACTSDQPSPTTVRRNKVFQALSIFMVRLRKRNSDLPINLFVKIGSDS
jgi:hypothetical protein